MKINELCLELEKTYYKYFPESKIVCGFDDSLYRCIDIKCFLAENKDEVAHGYWLNDIFNIYFMIDNDGEEIDKKINIDSEIDFSLEVECKRKSITIKPENNYMAYGSKQLKFRKTKGDGNKIINCFDKFCSQLKSELQLLLDSELIHDSHVEIVKSKLNTN